MNDVAKRRALTTLKVANLLMVLVLGVLIAHFAVQTNQNVADYKSLRVTPEVAPVSSSVSYDFRWCKYAVKPGTIFRDWVRAKNVDGKWVDDKSYLPLSILGSSRVGTSTGCYESTPSGVPTPSIPGDYRLRIRGEYSRILGAPLDIDEVYSNVVRVR